MGAGVGFVPHPSAIHKALYGVWVVFFHYVHLEEDIAAILAFIHIDTPSTAVKSYTVLSFLPTDSNAA